METKYTLIQNETEALRSNLAAAWTETEKAYAAKAQSDTTISQLQQQIVSLKVAATAAQPPKVSTTTTPDPEDQLVKLLKTANFVLSDTLKTVSMIARNTDRQERLRRTTMPLAITAVLVVGLVIWSPWNGRAVRTHFANLPTSYQNQPILPVASASDEPSVVALASAEASDLTIATTSTTPPMPTDEPRESLDVTIHRGLLQHGEVIQHALHQRLSALSQSPADNHAANAAYRRIRSKWQTIAQLYRTAASDDQAIVQQWATSLDEQFTEHPKFPSRYFIAKLH